VRAARCRPDARRTHRRQDPRSTGVLPMRWVPAAEGRLAARQSRWAHRLWPPGPCAVLGQIRALPHPPPSITHCRKQLRSPSAAHRKWTFGGTPRFAWRVCAPLSSRSAKPKLFGATEPLVRPECFGHATQVFSRCECRPDRCGGSSPPIRPRSFRHASGAPFLAETSNVAGCRRRHLLGRGFVENSPEFGNRANEAALFGPLGASPAAAARTYFRAGCSSRPTATICG